MDAAHRVDAESSATHGRAVAQPGPATFPVAGSAASNSGLNGDLLAIGDRRIKTVEVTNILISDEQVYEAMQATVFVEDARTKTRMGSFERIEDLGQGGTLDRNLGVAAGQGSKRGRDSYGYAHCLVLVKIAV